ncbi:hypothetical protein [Microbacterium sp. GXF7504]
MTAATPVRRDLRDRIGGSRWLPVVTIVLITVVGAVITWFRVPDGEQDRVWAEDANIFLHEALEYGPWNVLFNGYAGYQHFVPRLVLAVIFPFFDLADYAVLVFAICSVLTGLTAAGVYWLSRDLVPWVPARLTLAAVTLVLPLATQETVGNLADIHTYAMWLVPWLLLARPRTWGTSIGWALVTFAVVGTEVQAVFFVFLLAFRLRPRDRLSWPVGAAFLVASALQIGTAVLMGRSTGNGPLSVPSTVLGWMVNTVMPLVTADPVTIRAWILAGGVTVALIILVPLTAAAVIALVWGNGDQRVLTIALLLGSAAIYAGSAWANSDVWFMYAEEGLGEIERLVVNIRYGVASGMMLVAVVPVAAAVIVRRAAGRTWPRVVAGLACLGLVAVLSYGSTMTLSIRNWVGPWSPAVAEAVAECADAPATGVVTLPVAPDRSIDLTCEQVLAHTR